MSRISIKFNEYDGKKFYYADFGSETHGRTSFRLWVSSKLVQKDNETGKEYIEFPLKAVIIETEKGTKVLKPSSDTFVFDIFVPCGYRGGSNYEILSDTISEHRYYMFESPRGNLGVSVGGLIVTKQDKIKIKWNRTGRTYGTPAKGYRMYYYDGRVEEIDNLEEMDDLKELL